MRLQRGCWVCRNNTYIRMYLNQQIDIKVKQFANTIRENVEIRVKIIIILHPLTTFCVYVHIVQMCCTYSICHELISIITLSHLIHSPCLQTASSLSPPSTYYVYLILYCWKVFFIVFCLENGVECRIDFVCIKIYYILILK